MHSPLPISDTGITQIDRIKALLFAMLFIPVPVLHPLMIPYLGPPSHLLWWVYVAPVALLSYTFGIRGALMAVPAGIGLLIVGERAFGYGYGVPASWETTLSLAVALAITLLLIAALSVYAGQAAHKLRLAAYTHPLTRLHNRLYMDSFIADLKGSQGHHAVVFLDIDDFDAINYSLGYPAGDKVLIELAARLEQALEPGEILAHFAGDRFAVYLAFADWNEVDAVVKRIRGTLLHPLKIGDIELRVVSVGIGIASDKDGSDRGTLLQNAATALNHAKQLGRSGLSIFNQSMRDTAEKRLSIINELSFAIDQGQLLNHYQPIHDAQSGAIVGAEALVRWQHPYKGKISPGEFIPLAEQAGLIGKLGRAVTQLALDDFRHWRAQGLFDNAAFISINVSPLQLLETGFAEGLEQAANQRALAPASIVIEITETAMMQSEQASLQVLQQLRRFGFRIAIDDFGSGYSSLNYLHKLPVSILKIDRLLIQPLDGKGQPTSLVKPIVEIARTLDLTIIAEGVESQQQWDQLKVLGVNWLQGFHLSRPMPSDALGSLLRKPPTTKPRTTSKVACS
jgi:diguanylate cyclase (GGDEF)-like protein